MKYGIALGSAAGYHGGTVDAMVMRLVDLMLVFPRFFLLLAVASVGVMNTMMMAVAERTPT